MTKKETIHALTALMATVQAAYFKGCMEGHPLWVHERSDASAAISIDLYNFGGDGKPVCDGLTHTTVTFDDGSSCKGDVFCMCFNPDDVTPLRFLLYMDDDRPDIDVEPGTLTEEALRNITAWLQGKLEEGRVRKHVETKGNQVTAFMFYMWNAWCKEECKRAFSGHGWQHFWSKWCGICEAYGVHGAAERFYAELSNGNRNLLVGRAIEAYEGDEPKNQNGKA